MQQQGGKAPGRRRVPNKDRKQPFIRVSPELDSPARAAEGAKETLQISYRKFCGPCAGMVMAMDAAIAGAATGSNCSLSE